MDMTSCIHFTKRSSSLTSLSKSHDHFFLLDDIRLFYFSWRYYMLAEATSLFSDGPVSHFMDSGVSLMSENKRDRDIKTVREMVQMPQLKMITQSALCRWQRVCQESYYSLGVQCKTAVTSPESTSGSATLHHKGPKPLTLTYIISEGGPTHYTAWVHSDMGLLKLRL